MSKNSLANKIADILNTAPATFDPEDNTDETTAKLTNEKEIEDSETNEDDLINKFRTQNVDLLADVDERYAGKKISRKNDSEEIDSSSEDADSNISADNSQSDESTNDDFSDINVDSENDETNDLSKNNESTNKFKHLNDTNVQKQVTKGICVKNQLSIWEQILEIRIQLQKSLITANKLPQHEYFNEIKKQSGTTFSCKVAESTSSLSNVLNKMLQLQDLLLKQSTEYKHFNKSTESNENSENEEILSDTEEEKSELSDEENVPVKKKRKLSDYENDINEKYKKYKNYHNNIIKKWNDKTKIGLSKNSLSSSNVLNQIEHNLRNKEKLITRTQLKRSQYDILGCKNDDNTNDKQSEEYNTEIFDDDDFYHQLLRELIEVKSTDLTDPVQLSRQWIQLQNLRSKMKRKIDTKATKGRKIRYVVHTKLVNFMSSINDNLWTNEAKKELYDSLFGKG